MVGTKDRAVTEKTSDEGANSATKERHSAAPIDPRLVRRAQATRTYMISGVVVGCLTAVLVLAQAKLLSSSIASVFFTHSLSGLGITIALLVAVLAGRGVLAWASSWLAQRTSAAVKSQLRRDILAARLAAPAHQTSSSSSLVTLVTQGLDALDGYFSKYLPQLLLAVTVPVIIGAAILFSDWRSALIIAATIPFIPILMALVGWTTEKQVSRRWAYQSRLASHFADLVAGLPTLQVFGRAKAQAEGLRRTENANRRETMAILRISFLSAFVLELFSTLAVAVVAVVIGTRLVFEGMDFSVALFVLILAPEVYLPIRQVGVHYHDSADGLAAAEAAFAEIDRAGVPEGTSGGDGTSASDGQAGQGRTSRSRGKSSGGSVISDNTSTPGGTVSGQAVARLLPSDTSIVARNLTYTYPGTQTPIGPFDLTVNPGEIVALAGRSGGGKTTLLNCVLGFLTPDPVETPPLLLGGQDSRLLDWDVWRAGIAYVPQVPGMIDGTIADNVRLGCPDATDAQVRHVLDAAGASSLDLDRNVGEEGEGLSVGERRRVGIARALARIQIGGARLLILDEPTAGLDTDTEATVLLSLKESGATALVVSHREAVWLASTRVVEISTPAPVPSGPTPILTSSGSTHILTSSGSTPVSPAPVPGSTPVPTSMGVVLPHDEAESRPLSREASTSAPTGVITRHDDRKSCLLATEEADQATDASGHGLGLDESAMNVDSLPVPTSVGVVLPHDEAESRPLSREASTPAPTGVITRHDDRKSRPLVTDEAQEVPRQGDDTPNDSPGPSWHTRSPLMRLVFSLLDSVKGAKTRLVLAILLAAFASAAAVALMGVSAWLISKAAQRPSWAELNVAAVGVRFFGISRGVFRYIERLIGHDVALSMQSALRLKTYQALARTTLLGRKQGDLLVRVVADVGAIEDIVVRIVQPFAAASLVVLGVCAILGRFSVAASLLILASAIIGGLIVPWLTGRVSLRADEEAVPLRGELGVIVHNLSRNAVDLTAYGAQERALARMAEVDMALRKAEQRAAWAQGIGAGLQTIAAGIGFIGGLWIGSVAVANGTMGDRLLAVLVLTPLALHEVFSTFAQAAQTWTRARVALGRVNAILEAPPVGHGDVEARPSDEVPTLHCENLTIGWPDHPPVATGLDLDLAPGQAVGVMGPSGVGKTTLAATIMGLIPPVSGELETTGRIGYLAQDAHIFTTTIAENVRIGNKDATDDEVRQALAEAGLDMDLDRETGEMGVGLSGGEARRLALARLFVGDYRLLILDEPTEHLDRETADALMDEVFDGVARRPVVVISHDESVATRCDRVLLMD